MKNINSIYKSLKPTLVHKVKYSEYIEQDRNHKPKYAEEVEIEFVRVDITSTYNQTSSTETKDIKAVMFMYRTLTKPFKRLKEKSKITYDGKTYRIYKVVDCAEPYSDNKFSYEVELVDED